ncbi:hypothetical protein GCM10010339_51040 [Streptomyces alanosinicus]|uniref:Uncharacterized protein n=1 Tax=Streptomyces alanosinicus TaxID=68171 RepID=A0A918YLA8_9ACTN|nr:hypothetical protein GCM10010339_51040 [Streptomyces alanosinicus]
MSCPHWGKRWNSSIERPSAAVDSRRYRSWDHFGKADVKPVTEGTPLVHVHLLKHLHVNGVMIRVS